MQNGSMIRTERHGGRDVWEFRWREPGPNGKRKHRRMVVGNTDEFRDEGAARQAIAGLRLCMNSRSERVRVGSFASFAHLRSQPPDLTELHVPFCAYKNSSGCPKTLAIRQTGPEIGDGVVPFCACAKSGRSP
jgi:hypothetical protein